MTNVYVCVCVPGLMFSFIYTITLHIRNKTQKVKHQTMASPGFDGTGHEPRRRDSQEVKNV